MASDWEDGVRESLGSGWVPEGFQPLPLPSSLPNARKIGQSFREN